MIGIEITVQQAIAAGHEKQVKEKLLRLVEKIGDCATTIKLEQKKCGVVLKPNDAEFIRDAVYALVKP